jgi:hypothetical protein
VLVVLDRTFDDAEELREFSLRYLAGFANFGKPLADAEIHAAVPLCVHHSFEGEHVHALRSRERGCFLVVQTLWAEKIQSTTDAGSLNTFGRNEIEVAPISSALLRIACLVILYKTCRVPDQELAADGVSGPV